MKEIYFDNAATTQTDVDAAKTAVRLMYEQYANPSSLHEMGFRASQLLSQARNQVASLIGCMPEELIFTSGGTEANNLAILGSTRALKRSGNKVITTKIEHPSVRSTFAELAAQGFEPYEIKPLPNGDINFEILSKIIDNNTILVSCGLINSELGSISSIDKLVEMVKKINPNTLVHTDAVQAAGKIPFSVNSLGVDLLTISGHKIYAPKGVGALYVRKGVRVMPIMFGGEQENNLRPGTENTPAICAFGYAAQSAHQNIRENLQTVSKLRDYFIAQAKTITGININSPENASPYICNISVPGYRSETMLHYLADHNIYVSSGSACAKGKRSHVLTGIGLSNQRTDSALRISFNPSNTTEQIDIFFETLKQARKDLIRS